ncbi:hypothetical protein HMPREF9470_04879 [[Clostridium] citroniae WAL-19142]|jgi:hypothetical protein|uniref:Uncharacterized protein n=5 Tax=Enterocloster citroniae TaxID=358743 RepID=A0ABV2G6V1_9FIRM|nr:hypothetical protein [Enterocloster citroniae]KMW14231.1 hypothetical protein HMPREF9470_04879 [[Clostridium] citroniae WAL-19142]MCB7067200.1 hypothetical protein [Enterocloster citroniae]
MMQAYTDEMYYINDYLKGRKPVITTGFPFYARSASQIIDRYTFNRLKDVTEVPEEVQMCCCELAESEYRMEKQQKESGGKASEKIGTYSVSFSSAQESVQATAKEQRSIVMKWLADSGLCYQGV